jgi:4-amino-4-deoxy-L-arabinose transferase-like glycosyltransferase
LPEPHPIHPNFILPRYIIINSMRRFFRMSSVYSNSSSETILIRPRFTIQPKRIEYLALAVVVILAAIFRFANLSALGEVNHYYTAAVVSMLKSWHNFFFVAAEPGGSVSVDKPPLGLWLQAISAYFFGVNTLGVLLPQLISGILSVILLYYLVRRLFGPAAGLLAGLVLAITPVVIATDRNNTIDSTLIFVLLLAAWAFLKSAESPKYRYLLLGAALVGIGFNIKMLEAYLPLPAFYGVYLLGSSEKIGKKLLKLLGASVLLLVISLSWAVAVDLTPADQRPYVGSSSDDSEMSLIIGYNGVERLVGMFGRRGAGPNGNFRNNNFPMSPNGGQARQDGRPFTRSFPNNGFPNNQGMPNFNNRGGGAPGGAFQTGNAGPLRLFTSPLNKEVSWLLPFGIFSAALLLFRHRITWPVTPQHRDFVLWFGWLLTAGVFFSVAGFFHPYYLSTMAPPLAALVGIGIAQLWKIHNQHPWRAVGWIVFAVGATLAFQYYTAASFIGNMSWLPVVAGLFFGGAILAVIAAARKHSITATAGYACLTAAMLVTPGVWAGLTNAYTSQNQSLPAAYSGEKTALPNRGSVQVNSHLLDFLEANTANMKYLMAVPSSMQGADYVIATGRPVLYMGGFMGQDQVVTAQDLANLVSSGQLRYIYWDARGRGGMGSQPEISSWVSSACQPVNGFETTTRNTGAPDGTSQGLNNPSGMDGGGFNNNMQVSLYDCAGQP